MRIDIISVLPELMESPFQTSILKRAMQKDWPKFIFISFVTGVWGNTDKLTMKSTAAAQEW